MPSFYERINNEVVEYLANVQLQHKNKWEFVLVPALSVSGFIFSGLFTVATKFYLQNINIPFVEYETERVNHETYIKNIKYPEEFSATFLEDEKGSVLRLLKSWQADISAEQTILGFSTAYDHTFESDQEFAKKNCLVKLIGLNDQLTSLFYPTLSLRGVFPKKIEDYELSQDSDEHLLIKVNFSVDSMGIKFI
jgi:hypothetical protein